mmetsp:Transcript_73373/g.202512  ORF Transcript_73373/g.202512 Transcript_73373/m.202512 type:complete len:643 (+) Transcript_73373:791-2719(+)
MGAHDPDAKQERKKNGSDRLEEEGDQVGRWERVGVGVLGQRPLHGVGLEALSEGGHLCQLLAIIGAETQLHHNLLCHEVCCDHVHKHVVEARDREQDHVAHCCLILEAEAHARRDPGAYLVHDLVADHDDHGEGQAVDHAGLLPVVVVEGEDGVRIRQVEDDRPEHERQEDRPKALQELRQLLSGGAMAEVLPLHRVRLVEALFQHNCAALECEASPLQLLAHPLPLLLGVEDSESERACLDILEELPHGGAHLLLLLLPARGEDRLLKLVELLPHKTLNRNRLCVVVPPRGRRFFVLGHVLLEELRDLFLDGVEGPSDGHAQGPDTRGVLDALGEVLLHVLLPFQPRKALAQGNKVLHRGVVEVVQLKDPQLAHAVQDGANKRDHIGDHEEQHLRPHQGLLLLEAPRNKDAVISWRTEPPGSQDEKCGVDYGSEDHPAKADEQSPDNDRKLEVEVQHHARACHSLLQEVRVQWPKLPALAILFRGAKLLARAEVEGFLESLGVCDGPGTEVCNPHDQEDNNHQQDNTEAVYPVLELRVAQAIGPDLVEGIADLACVRSIPVVLAAGLDHWLSADALVLIRDDRLWVHGLALLRVGNAAEGAVEIVAFVLREERALRRAPVELAVFRTHRVSLAALHVAFDF